MDITLEGFEWNLLYSEIIIKPRLYQARVLDSSMMVSIVLLLTVNSWKRVSLSSYCSNYILKALIHCVFPLKEILQQLFYGEGDPSVTQMMSPSPSERERRRKRQQLMMRLFPSLDI